MRIGLTGGAATVDKMIEQAQRAEADGFSSLWFASTVGGDPMAAIAVVTFLAVLWLPRRDPRAISVVTTPDAPPRSPRAAD